jgi:RIO-like serine/threonine protein kinase
MISYYKKYKDKENIFKKISKKIDPVCYSNNKKSQRLCFYEKDKNDNIEKYFINENMFNWEVKVYLYLIDKNIVSLASSEKQKIIYSTNDKIPLFTILKNDDKNAKNILNNLFSFINKFKKIDFIHGNLHLYNIFVDKENMFTLIDFSYSSFKGICTNLFHEKYNNFDKNLIDFYTLYIELKEFYIKDTKMLVYLENLLKDVNHIHHNYNL